MRTILATLLALALGAATLSALAQPADAAAKPKIKFSVVWKNPTSVITTKDPLSVKWSVSKAPRGTKIVVARKAGKKWKTLKSSKARSAKPSIGRLPMGAQKLRLAVVKKSRVLASKTIKVNVFGKVSMYRLLKSNSNDFGAYDGATVSTGDGTYKYAWKMLAYYSGHGDILDVSNTSCTLIGTTMYVKNPDGADWTFETYVDGSPSSTSGGAGVVTSLDLHKSFSLYASADDPYSNSVAYGNGTAYCLTKTGHF